METKCQSAHLLHEYIDDELSEEQRHMLENHLKDCELCQKELRLLIQTNTMLEGLGEIEPSEAFNRSFWEKADAYEVKRKSGLLVTIFNYLWRPRLAIALMVLVVAGTIVFKTEMKAPEDEAMFLTVDINMLENFEFIDNLELLENLDAYMEETEEGDETTI